jgi:hypothetical protein
LETQLQPGFAPLPRRAAPQPAALSLAYAAFFAGVFLEQFGFRFSAINFTLSDAAMVMAAGLIVLARRPLRFLPPTLSAATYVFLLFACLSTLRAPEPKESVTQMAQFAFIFFLQLPVILTLASSRRALHVSLGLLVAARLVDAAAALLSGRASGAGRTLPVYGESANQLAYPTAYLIPFVLYGLLHIVSGMRSRRRQVAVIVSAVPALYLMVWVLAASGSRSATLATLIASVAFLTFRRGFELSASVIRRLALTMIVVGVAGYALYQSGYLPSTLQERVERTLRQDETLTEDRKDLAKAGWQAFLESPFVGVGLDNFRHLAHRYGLGTLSTDPHNMWIDLLVKVGLFGAAGVVTVIVGWFLMLHRTQRATAVGSDRELLSAFLASMAAIMTIHLFVPMMLQRQYWLIYGLGLACAFPQTWRPTLMAAREAVYAR